MTGAELEDNSNLTLKDLSARFDAVSRGSMSNSNLFVRRSKL